MVSRQRILVTGGAGFLGSFLCERLLRDDHDVFIRLMATEAVTAPVNIGNAGEFTMRELADLVIELTGSRSEIVHRPLPQDDPTERRPDITRARDLLGWQPKIALRDGLARTIAYFDAKLSGETLVDKQPIALRTAV